MIVTDTATTEKQNQMQPLHCQRCGRFLQPGDLARYKDLRGSFYYYCLSCDAFIHDERKNLHVSLLLPTLYGFIATLVASAGWAAFTIISGWQIGYVGIGAAYLISKAVLKGSKQKRTTKLQILTLALTAVSVFIANLVILTYFVLKQSNSQGKLHVALLGLIFSPSVWWEVTKGVAMTQGPIGWLIIALTFYTSYRLTDPKLISIKPEDGQNVNGQNNKPEAVHLETKSLKKKTSFYTVVYTLSVAANLIILLSPISTRTKTISVVTLGALAIFAVARARTLKQRYTESASSTTKYTRQFSIKRVLIFSFLGSIGIASLLFLLGYIFN